MTVLLQQKDIGINLLEFYVRKPDQPTTKYSMRVYDDAILAPYVRKTSSES